LIKIIAFEQLLKFEMLRELKRIEFRLMLENKNTGDA
jgi:hypothetical protein